MQRTAAIGKGTALCRWWACRTLVAVIRSSQSPGLRDPGLLAFSCSGVIRCRRHLCSCRCYQVDQDVFAPCFAADPRHCCLNQGHVHPGQDRHRCFFPECRHLPSSHLFRLHPPRSPLGIWQARDHLPVAVVSSSKKSRATRMGVLITSRWTYYLGDRAASSFLSIKKKKGCSPAA